MTTPKHILLTIDVEDWFQVENFKPWIPFSTWDHCELRVEKNVHLFLDLFDSIELPNLSASQSPAQRHPKATFFILGWIAERFPGLVREIQARGHEVASHGFNHIQCIQQTSSELKKELIDSKKRLEDLIGNRVLGFRAPNFSISDDILWIIEECGYLYDSSYNSFNLHDRYGHVTLNRNSQKDIAYEFSPTFFELPVSNWNLQNPFISWENSEKKNLFKSHVVPWSGGAYFRLIPFKLFKLGVRSILKKQNAYLFYLHPWEVDPEQPKIKKASLQLKIRHYTNLKKTASKLSRLIKEFDQCKLISCSRYLEQI